MVRIEESDPALRVVAEDQGVELREQPKPRVRLPTGWGLGEVEVGGVVRPRPGHQLVSEPGDRRVDPSESLAGPPGDVVAGRGAVGADMYSHQALQGRLGVDDRSA